MHILDPWKNGRAVSSKRIFRGQSESNELKWSLRNWNRAYRNKQMKGNTEQKIRATTVSSSSTQHRVWIQGCEMYFGWKRWGIKECEGGREREGSGEVMYGSGSFSLALRLPHRGHNLWWGWGALQIQRRDVWSCKDRAGWKMSFSSLESRQSEQAKHIFFISERKAANLWWILRQIHAESFLFCCTVSWIKCHTTEKHANQYKLRVNFPVSYA